MPAAPIQRSRLKYHCPFRRGLFCNFVRRTMRFDGRTRVRIPRRDCGRVVPVSSAQGGRGECRAPSAPAASCAKWVVQMHTSIHSGRTGNHPASPHAMVYGLFRPRRSGFLVTVASRISARPPGRARAPPRDLTPASRRQDHTTSPSASAPFVCAQSDRSRETRPAITKRAGTAASTASHPASMTMANAPLWDGMANHIV